jgi:hypothetical protein
MKGINILYMMSVSSPLLSRLEKVILLTFWMTLF